mmetsp:Transcript_26422/g.47655  ORF Transcript_26422/g.47655 Transcript_26422/m.47655 type:complete len:304 (+) Transcript_26422:101-1012(+)
MAVDGMADVASMPVTSEAEQHVSKAAAGYGQQQEAPKPKAKSKAANSTRGTIAHPLFQQAAAKADSCVFQNSATERMGAADASFESKAAPSAAVVFENKPRESVADAGVDHAGGNAEIRTVFESRPVSSRADVVYAPVASAALAEDLIHSAAEKWSAMGSGQSSGIVFESVPKASVAQTSASSPVLIDSSSTVFESKPSQSKADVASGTAANAASARAVIEKAAEEAELAASPPSQHHQPVTVDRAREAQALIQAAAASHDASSRGGGGFVFESKPAHSIAKARHGEDYSSSGEEETDEEGET